MRDLDTLPAMELRQRYPGEANSHHDMKKRAPKLGRVVHPEFESFRSFLRHVGPKPSPSATLDRIDNSDPEYGPGKVRWADARTQNNNKGDTILLHYSRTGEVYTVSRLAKLQGGFPSTIRKRLSRGWTDDEIIEGRRANDSAQVTNSASIKKKIAEGNVVWPSEADLLAFTRTIPSPHLRLSEAPNLPGYHLLDCSDPALLKSARAITWIRRVESVKSIREEYGEEYVVPPIEEIFGDCLKAPMDWTFPEEQCSRIIETVHSLYRGYDRKFLKWYEQHAPLLLPAELPDWAQRKLTRLIPGWPNVAPRSFRW